MQEIEKTLSYIWKLILFVIVAVLFLPSYLIVTYLQPVWAKMLTDLFGL